MAEYAGPDVGHQLPPAGPNDFSQQVGTQGMDPFAQFDNLIHTPQQTAQVNGVMRDDNGNYEYENGVKNPAYDARTGQPVFPLRYNNPNGTFDEGSPFSAGNGGVVPPSGSAAAPAVSAATAAPTGVEKLLQALVGAGGLLAGHALANSAQNSAVPPQLSQLLQMGVNRAQYQNPLFQAMTSGAYQMLPDFAKTGIKPPSGTI